MELKKFIPAIEWMSNYNKSTFSGDLSAGLTVGVMLVPQGMAYAMIAGLPPIYGLYSSIVPLLIYALLGTSRQLAVGPVAMVSLLTASGIGILAGQDQGLYIELSILLAFMVGLIQFSLGVFRLGFLVNFLSHPVISGFTSAAALIIGLSQLKHLLGIEIDRSHHVHEILFQAFDNIGHTNWWAVLIGVTGILLIKGGQKINRSIPGPLIAVVFGILAVWYFQLPTKGLKIVGAVPGGLPSFNFPAIEMSHLIDLLPIALAISMISFMESIAVAKSIQARHRDYKIIPNQELIALGIANIGGSFFQSYPTTGGFSRTAVNDQAGAKTGMASIISAGLIVVALLFLTPVFYFLPKAILASIIMVAVFGLINIKEVIYLWKTDRSDFWMLLVTFVTTLGLGIEQGVFIGVFLSLAWVLYRSTKPHVAVLGRVPDTYLYRNVNRFGSVLQREDLLIIRFDASLYFANTSFFKEQIFEKIDFKNKKIKAVIINADSINEMDSSGLHTVKEIRESLSANGIRLIFTGVKGPVRDAMTKAGLYKNHGDIGFFMSVQEAVDNYDNKLIKDVDTNRAAYTFQNNIFENN